MSRKGTPASRSLEYHAPPQPAFLRALQAQIPTRQAFSSNRPKDELESLVSSTSSGKRKADDDGEPDGEDEFDGAQVVVLDDGLSREEATAARRAATSRSDSTDYTDSTDSRSQSIAGASIATKKRRAPIAADDTGMRPEASITHLLDSSTDVAGKDKSSNLNDVKQLIRTERSSTQSKPAKEKTKEQRKAEKTAKARRDIKRSGKGLSFDLDD
ncbi:protein of unknown function DUF4604 [Kalmanozyma brasiliensis GHG001]|uniref:DUF4604 domain-containing protein n=1 Tax=Kalmanozyma brasiliensis (strain GHG001) TaxID=1365824 RepID=V5EF09_KALBG|nr:protein of unknown function DUF4604 [Kalmanozyma brasiliensis GHG001]EST09051.1 protein of unknown function DUF4604 [Kalmanozyma brasiliensis GHG001]